MTTRNKKESSTISIVDAIETLSKISELEFDHNIGISQSHNLILQDQAVSYRTVHWLHQEDADKTVSLVKDTFRTILNYLRHFYKKEYGYITDEQTIEGIKTIMVLVGEAAKKLDKYTNLFHQTQLKSVTELKEYKKLQDFYLTRIARKIDEGVLGKWILALTKKALVRKEEQQERRISQTKHVFVDLDSVKKDAEYELFFMRKEDGSRFFSPRLLRNIKLISDFGEYFGKYKGDDPLSSLEIWQDRFFHSSAKNILRHCSEHVAKFYRVAQQSKEKEMVDWMNKSTMALMLACNPHNLMHNIPIKSCRDYFYDFQNFLNKTMHSDEYKKMLAYPPKHSDKLNHYLLELIHQLCFAFCSQLSGYQEINSMIHSLLQEANQNFENQRNYNKTLSNRLLRDYSAMTKLFKQHPHGCLNKLLETLERGDCQAFAPLVQENIPGQLFEIYTNQENCSVVRMPFPTQQEFIHKATVDELFKGFLRGCEKDKKVLFFNLQDSTSWKEFARSKALEDLSHGEDFAKHLSLVSINSDSEFFHQLSPYHQDNQVEVFIKHLKKQIANEANGFVFPSSLKKQLNHHFVDGIIDGIHQVFFSGKNVLSREQRLNFIELFLVFLQLKLIDLVKPEIVVFSCKDGVDVSQSSAALLFAFLKLTNQEVLSDNDQEQLDLIIYAPSVLMRERLMHSERFHRWLSTLKCIEELRNQSGQQKFAKLLNEAFGHFFKRPILKSKLVAPHHK